MKVIVLMAGEGTRVKDYSLPKPLIEVVGSTILDRTLKSCTLLNSLPPSDLCFAIRTEHDAHFNISETLQMKYGYDINIVSFGETTRGNLDTAQMCVNWMDVEDGEELLILDCDNAYTDNNLTAAIKGLRSNLNAVLTCHFDPIDTTTHWAFVDCDPETRVVHRVMEKDPTALTRGAKPLMGVFWFSTAKTFMDAARSLLATDQPVRGSNEFFMSQIPAMLAPTGNVYTHKVTNPIPLGTPSEIETARYNLRKRIVIDMDGTICANKQELQSYADVLPLPGAVETINRWHASGHYIIIQTARHMRTCNGNEGLVLAVGGKLLIDWLAKYNIPYDELYFGKPHADYFLDDKGRQHISWDNSSQLLG